MARLNRNRSNLLLGCGSAALALGLAMAPQHASAQAIQATETFVSGSGSRNIITLGTETITIDTPTAIIDWTPDEDALGNALDFLPTGNTVTYQNGVNTADFAVLNRILPSTNGNVVVMDGTVLSRIFDATGASSPGGTVAFYSPTGLLIGGNAVFDVGNLILTTLDPSANFDSWALSGQTVPLDFIGATGTTAQITINPGAQIQASPENSYFAVIGADIRMFGTALVNGSHAYIAGEQVSVTVSNGLFNIEIPVGTSVGGVPLQINGTVGGPSSNGLGDNHLIYAVAAAQTDPISLLFSGNLGFAPAAQAGIVNGEIILSANYNVNGRVVDGGSIDQGINAIFDARSELTDVEGNIFVQDFNASSSILAIANNQIQVSAFQGPSVLDGNLIIVGRGSAELTASNNQTFDITGDVYVSSDAYGIVGSNLLPGEADAVAGLAFIDGFNGGVLTIDGNVLVSASAVAGADVDAEASGLATGGTAIIASNGGSVLINGSAQVASNASETQNLPTFQLGNIFDANLAQIFTTAGGSVTINGDTILEANATGTTGSQTLASTPSTALGGQSLVEVFDDGSSITLNGNLIATASAFAGSANVATAGGLADAGETSVYVEANGTINIGGDVLLQAIGNGGTNGSGQGGEGRGGASRVFVQNGGAVNIGGNFEALAFGTGGVGISGGDGFGGIAGASVITGLVDIEGNARADAGAQGGNAIVDLGGDGGDGTGGNSFLQANGTLAAAGTLNVGLNANLTSTAFGGSGGDGDGSIITAGNGGIGRGGQIGTPNQADTNFGGGAFLLAGGDNGNLTVLGSSVVENFGIGGDGGDGGIGQTGGNGGFGQGGTAQVGSALLGLDGSVAAGTVSLGDVLIQSNGEGGDGGLGGGTGALRGNGGDGEGFAAFFTARAGTVNAGLIDMTSDGTGGEGHVGGNGSGGFTSSQASLGASVAIERLRGFAVGRGGFGDNAGGNAFGGEVNLVLGLAGFDVTDNIFFDSGSFGGEVGSGPAGDSTAGISNIGLTVDGGFLTVGTDVELRSVGEARTGNTNLQGATGTGGDATINVLSASTFQIVGNLRLDASGIGGNNIGTGAGGDAFGGRRGFAFVNNGGTLSVGGAFDAIATARGGNGVGGGDAFGGVAGTQVLTGTINLLTTAFADATGTGGDSISPGGFGGDGGQGQGGYAAILAQGTQTTVGTITIGGNATLLANGQGGSGGDGDGSGIAAGRGGAGRGGTFQTPVPTAPGEVGGATLVAGGDNGVLTVGGTSLLNAVGAGGSGGSGGVGQAGGDGGTGFGGSATSGAITLGTDGSVGAGTATYGSVFVLAGGNGGNGGFGGSALDPRGNGGDGFGFRALFAAEAGTVVATDVLVTSTAQGGDGLTGGDGTGGERAGMYTNADGTMTVSSFQAFASGFGGDGLGGLAGDGRGGQAFIGFQDGTTQINGDARVEASGIGGNSDTTDGGDGFGGVADIAIFSPVFGQGTITGHANVLASGIGGGGGNGAVGGDGTGGQAFVSAQAGGTVNLGSVQVAAIGAGGTGAVFDFDGTTITYTANGGDGFGGTAEIGAIGTGSLVRVQRNTPTTAVFPPFGAAMISATGFGGNANGGTGIGGDGTGGEAYLFATNGGSVQLPLTPNSDPNSVGPIRILSRGQGGNSSVEGGVGGIGTGGLGVIDADGGTISMGETIFSVFSQGGSSLSTALNITGGAAFGGDRQVIVENGGTLTAELSGGVSGAVGGNGSGTGNGGNATGGVNSITVSGGTFNAVGRNISVDQTTGGNGNVGGNASGGTSTVSLIGGTLNILPNSNGIAQLGVGGFNTGGTGIATGGSATGGNVVIDINESDVTGGSLDINVNAIGGNADNANGTGGDATAGAISFISQFSNLVILGDSGIVAGANGGTAANGGNATGGVIDVTLQNTDVDMTGAILSFGGDVNAGVGLAGTGGDAVGVDAELSLNGVDWTGGNISFENIVRGGDSAGTGANGGSAAGDLLSFSVTGNSTLSLGSLGVDSTISGGNATSGTGGTAIGGEVLFEALDSDIDLTGNVRFFANSEGGDGIGGGDGNAGEVTVNISNANLTIAPSGQTPGALLISADGLGGRGQEVEGGARGGRVDFYSDDGIITADRMQVTANALAAATTTGADGGRAVGGDVDVIFDTDSIVEVGDMSLLAQATTSAGNAAFGGTADLFLSDPNSLSPVVNIVNLQLSVDAVGGFVDGTEANVAGRFSVTVTDGDLTVQNLLGSALGNSRNEFAPSSLVAVGGNIFVSGNATINVLDDFDIVTGQGGLIGGPSVLNPTAIIDVTSQGTVTIEGDDDNRISFGGDSLSIASRDIVIASGARIGANSMNFTSLETDAPAILGGGGTPVGGVTGEGYSFIAEELGRLEVGSFSFFQPQLVEQSVNEANIVIRDVTISGSLDDGVSSVEIAADGGLVRVEGVVAYVDAGVEDSFVIDSARRIEIITPGGIGIVGPDERPTGFLNLDADNIWIADAALISELRENSTFEGRNDLLAVAAAGSDDPLGYLRAGSVLIEIEGQLLVRNTGTDTAQGGILVGSGGLSIIADDGGANTSESGLDVFAYGAQIDENGNLITGEEFYRLVNFNTSGSEPTIYSDLSEFNDCIINTGVCPEGPTNEESADPAIVSVNNPSVVEAAVAATQPIETTEQESNDDFGIDFPGLVESEDLEEENDVEDPVASGGDSSLYGQGTGGNVRVEGN